MAPLQFAGRVELPRAAPETQGIPSAAVLDFLDATEQKISELHSFMLLRRGVVIAEGWWHPYSPERLHSLFSLSKSFTASAVGLAIAEGRLALDDRVLDFFPEEAPPRPDPNMANMRIRHLLSMSTGHDVDTTERLRGTPDGKFIRAFLHLPVEHEPGTHFAYNSAATYVLSAIIQRLSCLRLLDYLRPRLLDPLGIGQAAWEQSPEGIDFGGWGMSLATEDIARFGQLCLQGGAWQGRKLLPPGWVELASAKHISNGSNPESDWEQGYGFQFWRSRHDSYRGDGAFGQNCLILPEQEAVVATTAATDDHQGILNLVWEILLPAMASRPLPADPAAEARLRRRLAELALLPPAGQAAPAIRSGAYRLQPNRRGLEEIRFDFGARPWILGLTAFGLEQALAVGDGAWEAGSLASLEGVRPVVSAGAWLDEHTFELVIRYIETPFVETFLATFDESVLTISGRVNVAIWGEKEYPSARGVLKE
jgi:CubicO group peptidase (beta-lactamase class C family)